MNDTKNEKPSSSESGNANADAIRIIGIDPAAKCGWAHSGGPCGVWQITSKGDKHPGRRLERFRRYLFKVKRDLGIDLIAAEDAAFGSRVRSVQALHDELKGILKLCAAEWEIPILLLKPTSIKKWLTGNGRADKQQMILAVRTLFGVETSDDNLADAVAIMEMAKGNVTAKVN